MYIYIYIYIYIYQVYIHITSCIYYTNVVCIYGYINDIYIYKYIYIYIDMYKNRYIWICTQNDGRFAECLQGKNLTNMAILVRHGRTVDISIK